MLKTMRKNVKSLAPTLWIVIAAFIIAIFAVWGGAGRLGEGPKSNIIASIGAKRISSEDYYQTLRQRLETLQRQFKELNKTFIQQLNIPQQVLEQMVQQGLLEQKAREMGITASDKEVRDRIVSLFQRDGKFVGYEEYQRIVEWNRMSTAEFEESLKRDIVLNKTVQLLTANITATPEEIWENHKKQNETAKIEYLLLDESKVQLDEALPVADVQAYFEKNKDKYSIPEKREGAYIFFSTEDLQKEIKLTDADIEKYYRDNLEQFKEPARIRASRIYLLLGTKEKAAVQAEAQSLRERISKGEDFAELARANSQDEKASGGGDWGFDEWRKLSAREREEIEKLNPGELSEILEIDSGAVILKVTEKEAEKTLTLEEVKARIKTILEDEKARDLGAGRASQLEKSARKEKSLDFAAQRAGLKVKKTGLLKQGQGLEDFDPAGSISQALFGLKEREISTPLYTFSGTGICQLEKVEPARPAQFDEVREDVEKDLKNAKKKEIARKRTTEARERTGGQGWEEMATKLGLEYKTVNEHRREQYLATIGESPEIDRLAFSLPLNEVSEPIEFPTGFALLRVLERKEASREEFEKNQETERNNFLETKKNGFLQSFLERLREEKKVRINYNLFTQINADILSRYGEQQ